MKSALYTICFLILTFVSRGQEPIPYIFIKEMSVDWVEGEPEMIVSIFGNRESSPRDSICETDVSKGLFVDADKVRFTLEDAEGRKCDVKAVRQLPITPDSTGRLLSRASIRFLADDGGSPRLPITGRMTIRVHETSPECTEVEHILHMVQWHIQRGINGPVTDFRDNYLAIKIR